MMKQVDIKTVDELIKELNTLPNHYMFRGHIDANWQLESSLERVIGSKWSSRSAKKYEERALDVFESKFHLYDHENLQPNSKLAWLSVMQHYGVPTRLLDFTESPYVALYFALEEYDPESCGDFSIIALDYASLMEASINYISERREDFQETRYSIYKNQDVIFEKVDQFCYDIAWIAEPRQFNKRLDRQAGSFLLSTNPDSRIKEVLSSPIYKNCPIIKYRIAKYLYSGIFPLLRKMNITGSSLYGDLHGLARFLKMEMRVYAAD